MPRSVLQDIREAGDILHRNHIDRLSDFVRNRILVLKIFHVYSLSIFLKSTDLGKERNSSQKLN